jgi:hypothetical protein
VTAARSRGRRGRSRKRRTPGGSSTHATPLQNDADAASEPGITRPDSGPRGRRARQRARAVEGGAFSGDAPAPGERPRPPWYPLPLSELLILIGAIATVVGFSRREAGRPLLLAGIGAVMLGTIEFSLREHLGGYRSHTILLAFIPTVAVHTVLALVLAGFGLPTAAAGLGPLVVDVALFAFLFKLLRARFLDARRERKFAGGR